MNSNRSWFSLMVSMKPFRVAASAAVAGALMSTLSGCGMSSAGKTGTTGVTVTPALHLSGNVHGGQQPVSGSTIQIYAVGTGGLRSAATPLIAQTVVSDANGNFNVTGDYTCPTPAGQNVYLTATGGNPGAGVNCEHLAGGGAGKLR